MESDIEKSELECVIVNIQVLNNKLAYWLDIENSKLDYSFFSKSSVKFNNFKLDNCEFLYNNEIIELHNLDNDFSDKKMSIKFEKNLLQKNKNIALSNMNIPSVINLSKMIEGLSNDVNILETEINTVVDNYTKIIQYRIDIYNKFKEDMSSSKSIKQIIKNGNYDKHLVCLYQFNKIVEYITEMLNNTHIDLDRFFDQNVIKNLLANNYLDVKQKVEYYVGANN